MRIGVIGSMQFTEQLLATRDQLIALGHDAFVTDLAVPFVGKTDQEKEVIKIEQKMHQGAIREFWRIMQGADAVLVVNPTKKGIENYIGANTFLEMGFAHVLEQKIFVLYGMPDIQYIWTEYLAMRPQMLDGNLSLI